MTIKLEGQDNQATNENRIVIELLFGGQKMKKGRIGMYICECVCVCVLADESGKGRTYQAQALNYK